ncbi:maleylpyruvate isomerase N-terminal domain-containing protein [Haloglycomyces albus]|uniref:maleylpyruvate isomerase N-terminal domain-containing protein n=1 Tax=Haloglycomyces albus TaxID=526067 RepID=UPI00046D5520|nr:maleylpyruvate isomerase N-terminal domain-containing protein [Haloglycomyces albus]
MSQTRSCFLATAETTLKFLDRPETSRAWDEPSALPEFQVSGLVAHTLSQITNPVVALQNPKPEQETIGLFDHFERAAWTTPDIHNEANTGIRQSSDKMAEKGYEKLFAYAEDCYNQLVTDLPHTASDATGASPTWPHNLSLDDYLRTRIMEMVVHSDDVAQTLGIAAPTFAPEAYDLTYWILTRLAAARHGHSAVIAAMARGERATGSITAF